MLRSNGPIVILSRYILRVLQWARKYGLRVYLDLHTIPGSQNGMLSPVLRRTL